MRGELRVVARGVTQGRTQIRQFQIEMDEREQWWSLDFDGGHAWSYRDGQLSMGSDHPARAVPFAESAIDPIRMLWPEKLTQWGRGRESFSPVLVQRIGTHSMLFTNEHVGDPAFRSTLVIDERTGLASKFAQLEGVTIITEVRPLSPSRETAPPTFSPLLDWIRMDY